MSKNTSERSQPRRAGGADERVRRALERLAEAEKKFAPFTQPIEYPWISTHDKWGLGDAASIRNLRAGS
ncbi:MAG: hypothetical protein KJ058_02010 [Thermoanaerobaculia bacterium]|nr:hypothetical protein [Thermoanaerobaculia bacterium]